MLAGEATGILSTMKHRARGRAEPADHWKSGVALGDLT
jgi:hypothetical protein